MATNTAGTAARELHTQQVHYLRMAVNFATPGIANGVAFPNLLPAGAQILNTLVHITTAFVGGTPAITVGQNATSYNDMVASTDTSGIVGGTTAVIIATGANLLLTADTTVYVKLNPASVTAGALVVVVAYVPNNDA